MTTRNLAVLAGNFAYSYPVKMLGAIKSRLKPGQGLVHYPTQIKPDIEQRRFLSVLDRPGPTATIGISIRPDEVVVAAYKKAQAPIILIDETAGGITTIAVDNYRGGVLAGQHLVKMGRRNIAIVCGTTKLEGSFNAIARLKGLRDALAANGLALPDSHIAEVMYYSYQEGTQVLKEWLDKRLKIDAIFSAAGDDCATGMLRTAQERGVRVPADIAIIGFDDLDSAKSTTPPLTTVKQPIEKMAELAYELASDGDNDIVEHPRQIILPPELVVRSSA